MYYENDKVFGFYSFKKKIEVFIPTATFGSTTNYCNFYPFSVYKCQGQQLYNNTVKTIYCKTCYM